MPDFAFSVCARAKRRILDDFGSFLLVLGRYCCFQVLLGLDIPIYHSPETSGTPESQLAARGRLISSILAPLGARGTPCEVFCAHENDRDPRGTFFCSRVVGKLLAYPPSTKKWPPGAPVIFMCTQNPFFSYHFRSSEAPQNGSPGTRRRFLVSRIDFRTEHVTARFEIMLLVAATE